jgi:hypothetical protein
MFGICATPTTESDVQMFGICATPTTELADVQMFGILICATPTTERVSAFLDQNKYDAFFSFVRDINVLCKQAEKRLKLDALATTPPAFLQTVSGEQRTRPTLSTCCCMVCTFAR